jgi:hypothetical protein
MLCLGAGSLYGATQGLARPDAGVSAVIEIVGLSSGKNAEDTAVRKAAATFIRAMAEGNSEAVWMFALEEEQAAFGTEAEAYKAFADAFPELTAVQRVTYERGWQEGETPFLQLGMEDASGNDYRATIGFWLDDAGDWKVVSCDIDSITDAVASVD